MRPALACLLLLAACKSGPQQRATGSSKAQVADENRALQWALREELGPLSHIQGRGGAVPASWGAAIVSPPPGRDAHRQAKPYRPRPALTPDGATAGGGWDGAP